MIKVQHVNTKDQLADILTKSLGRKKFLEMREKIGVQAVTRGNRLPSTEEQLKVEDMTKKKCCHQRMDELTAIKLIPEILGKTAKTMPTMRSSNHVWDPGHNDNTMFKGVNVRVKHGLAIRAGLVFETGSVYLC